MTTTPETAPTTHVDVIINLPLDNGGVLPIRQGIGAIPTETEGLVVFPRLLGPFEIDDDAWCVTHVGTGRRIPAMFEDQEHATLFANAAAALADWSERRPRLALDVRLKVVRLAKELGGRLDQRIVEQLERHDAKESA